MYFMNSSSRCFVLSVIDGGGAQQAGIQENDMIIKINDVNIELGSGFTSESSCPGDTVNVTIKRMGSEIVFQLQ